MASVKKRPDGKYRARYRDREGREHARHFDRKVDADRWVRENASAVDRGDWIDPNAGKVTVKTYGEQWRAAQVHHRISTAASTESNLRVHIYPALGNRPLGDVKRSDIQAFVAKLSGDLASSSVVTVYAALSSIFRSAVMDRLISISPCEGVKLPKVERKPIEVMSAEQVERSAEELPERLRAMVFVGAGCGLRQGECFGLTVDRVDFLRRTLKVDRQLVNVPGHGASLAPPKTDASVRTVPLPAVVANALAAHLAAFPPGPDGLIFTGPKGSPMRRSEFARVWRPAADRAGLDRSVTFHDLRHFYASALIKSGCSVKTVQHLMGHSSAAMTLDVYAGLWPDSDDTARAAIDAVFTIPADYPRTDAVIES